MADAPFGQAGMPEQQDSTLDRIDRAIARIAAAAAARTASGVALDRRHEALRARMAEAIAALDTVLSGADTESGR